MAILFDHICDTCNHTFEGWVDKGVASRCPQCGGEASKVPGGNVDWKSMGLHADSFPTCGDKWARLHEEKARRPNPDRDESGW